MKAIASTRTSFDATFRLVSNGIANDFDGTLKVLPSGREVGFSIRLKEPYFEELIQKTIANEGNLQILPATAKPKMGIIGSEHVGPGIKEAALTFAFSYSGSGAREPGLSENLAAFRDRCFLGAGSGGSAQGTVPSAPSAPSATAQDGSESAKLSVVLEGEYDAHGTNPDRSRYSGTCRITKIGENSYRLDWSVGGSYTGTGTLQGQTLTVDWGSDSPVIYEVQGDGMLIGTWAKGSATETLRPRG